MKTKKEKLKKNRNPIIMEEATSIMARVKAWYQTMISSDPTVFSFSSSAFLVNDVVYSFNDNVIIVYGSVKKDLSVVFFLV